MVGKKSRSKRGVEKQDLLKAAFELFANAGEEGFSIRKVGAAADVDPMTVLHHFGSKNGLLRTIADHAVTMVKAPIATDDWRHDLRAVAKSYRELAHRYPRVFHLHFRYHATGPADHVSSEVVYSAVRRAGLSDAESAGGGLAFYAFVLGFALAEIEGLLRPIGEADEAELLALDEAHYGATRALVPAFKELDPNAAFDVGLEAFIAGLADRVQHGASVTGGQAGTPSGVARKSNEKAAIG